MSELQQKRILWIMAAICLAMILVLTVRRANAACEVVWHPGDVIFVDAGHDVHVKVESEDVAAYEKVRVPQKYLPIPTDANLEKLNENGQHSWKCGDYVEVDDNLLYGADQ